jgi:hypothetical protein
MSTSELALTRREFVVAAMAVTLCRSKEASAPGDVLIVQFSDSGERQAAVRVPKVVKTDAEWQKQLTPLAC